MRCSFARSSAHLTRYQSMAGGIGEQPGGKPEFDQEGLLPAPSHPDCVGTGGTSGFRYFFRGAVGADGVLRDPADMGDRDAAAVRAAGGGDGAVGGAVAVDV